MTDPVDAFRAEFGEALATAEKFARSADMGLPPDRWVSNREMHLVAKGIRALQHIIGMQTDVILGMAENMGDSDANAPND